MTLSINTNAAALNALQSLNRTTSDLGETQLRINTGLEVNGAKDNAAIFAIAQNLRADRQGLDAIKSSIDRATSVLDISMAAAESIQELLIDMKEKVTQAADEGLPDESRQALQKDFDSLRDQIVTIAKNATFNGTNMLDGPPAPPTKPATLVALVSVDATLKIEVPRQNLQLADAGSAPTADNVIKLAQDTTFTTAAEAEALIAIIDASIKNVSEALTVMGAGSNSMDRQGTFIVKLGDTVETGIGNMVDADMARESARLTALQVKQQLGTQALSIANQQPQAILSLFNKG